MVLTSIITTISGLCVTRTTKVAIKSIISNASMEGIDKFAIPVGTTLISCMVGDTVEEYIKEKFDYLEKFRNEMAEARKALENGSEPKEEESEPVENVVNIFDKVNEEEGNGSDN